MYDYSICYTVNSNMDNNWSNDMNSRDYKVIIRTISFNALKKRFPGLDKKHMTEVAAIIALNIHARMYGANVDGVDSPIWQDKNHNPPQPKIDAKELLNETKAHGYFDTTG